MTDSSFSNQGMSIAVTQRMGEHLVLLVKVESRTRIGLQQSRGSGSGSGSNKITDLGCVRIMDMAVCRICHDEDQASNMEAPCSCCGSLKLAHRKCVQMWCDAKGDIVCEICRQQFKPGYKAPPPRFCYNGVGVGVGTNFIRGTLSTTDDEDGLEFPLPSSTSFICCQILAIIFTGLIVLRHALPILVDTTGDYSLTLFSILTIGILIPICVVFKAFTAIKRLQQQGAQDSSNEENESQQPQWVHIL